MGFLQTGLHLAAVRMALINEALELPGAKKHLEEPHRSIRLDPPGSH